MKQSRFVSTIVMGLLFCAILIYLGALAWRSFSDPFVALPVFEDTVDEAVEVTGLLVRDEIVLPGAAGTADFLFGEGEKVGAGQTVAVYYQDEAALSRKQEIRALELELEQLDYSMRQSGDLLTLDTQIIASVVALRGMTARGTFSGLDDEALVLKSLISRREYTYSGAAVESLSARAGEIRAQISALHTAAAGDTSSVVADQPGVFSGLSDGYEAVLTPAALNNLTVASLTELSARFPAPTAGAAGKLISGTRWYFAAILPQEHAARLYEGSRVLLSFSHDFSGEVLMDVEQVSAPEDGRAAVVFSSARHLSDITLLRRQTVLIVFERHTGIRVPQTALRVLTETVTDAETGAVTEQKIPGVYSVTGVTAEFRPVTVVAQTQDYYLVTPNPRSAADRRILRPGDEVIVASEDLYDGKVVR